MSSPSSRKRPVKRQRRQQQQQQHQPNNRNGGYGDVAEELQQVPELLLLQRPEPPPPPPASLVRLIQKDAAVLEYFQALQSNLDYDVQKWKSRARALEQKQNEQQQQQQQQQRDIPMKQKQRPAVDTTTAATNTANEHEGMAKESKGTPSNSNNNGDDDFALEFSSSSDEEEEDADEKPKSSSFGMYKKNVASALDLSSSSEDEDEDEDEKGMNILQGQSRFKSSNTGGAPPPGGNSKPHAPALSADIQQAIDQLHVVLETLEELGIPLLEKEKIIVPPPLDDATATIDNSSDTLLQNLPPLLADDDGTGGDDDVEKPPPPPPPATTGTIEEESSSRHHKTSTTPIQYIVRRRSDHNVVIDIVQFIRALTRIKHVSNNNNNNNNNNNAVIVEGNDENHHSNHHPRMLLSLFPYYYPFMTEDSCIPCYMRSGHTSTDDSMMIWHPAVSGVEKLLMCLCYMDAFCPALDRLMINGDDDEEVTVTVTVEEHHETTDRNREEALQQLFVAMKGRHALVSSLLQSLEGEIVETWAVQDRSSRILQKATHCSTESTLDDSVDQDHGDAEASSSIANNQGTAASTSTSIIPFGTKNFVRLSGMVERCILAKIVSTLYLQRHDPQKAFQFFWSYFLSTTPALDLEDHPKLPPVQSFCVLEAILTSSVPDCRPVGGQTTTAKRTLLDWILVEDSGGGFLGSSVLLRMLGLAMESTAQIYQERSGKHLDDRITDVSRAELAAHERLMNQGCRNWGLVGSSTSSSLASPSSLTTKVKFLLSSDHTERDGGQASLLLSTTLALTLQGDAMKVDEEFEKALAGLRENVGKVEIEFHLQERLLACVSAKKQLEIRRLDDYRRIVNTPMTFSPNKTGIRHIQSFSTTFVNWLVSQDFARVSTVVVTAFRCCHACADAESIFRLVQWVTTHLPSAGSDIDPSLFSILDAMETMSRVPTVHIINLERRPDRMAAFSTQAMCEGLMFLKGVSALGKHHKPGESQVTTDLPYFGQYAFDGQGKAAEVERRLVRMVGGGQEALNALVERQWMPNELKPFDTEAPDSDKMALISPSEKACALSHISCWKGIERCLSTNIDDAISSPRLLRNPTGLCQRILSCGFARGASLFPANDGMEPSPVFLILEDDAILVDRFNDRLSDLLEELPRDFHFCSLGYSRPKTAPLVPFSSQLGIPTSIWYLTGYILSLDGARYLLNKLPVRGPVDSWIGLSMFSNNWDNIFGHAMGVGVSTKPPNDPSISTEDLRKVLRFRAFAATIPLCSQKVGANLADLPSTGRNWRQRDTDIVYSGNTV